MKPLARIVLLIVCVALLGVAFLSAEDEDAWNDVEFEELEKRVAEIGAAITNGEIARPAHWGGYCLVADRIEFWQGRTSRLHDRLRYRLDNSAWIIERLAP